MDHGAHKLHVATTVGISLLVAATVITAPEIREAEAFDEAPVDPFSVTAEFDEGSRAKTVSLCDATDGVIAFDRPIEQKVYDVLTAYKTGMDETLERLTAKVIVAEAERHALDPWLVIGLIRVESRFFNFAESNKGARGLMQILPFVGEELAAQLGIVWSGPDTLYNPMKNVRMGVAYLAHLHRRFDGNLERVLQAYNMGPNRVARWLDVGRELPTGYSSLVVEYRGLLRKAGAALHGGADLRRPITSIERSMAQRKAQVVLPAVADLIPVDAGQATEATPGLLAAAVEPAIEPLDDESPIVTAGAFAPWSGVAEPAFSAAATE